MIDIFCVIDTVLLRGILQEIVCYNFEDKI